MKRFLIVVLFLCGTASAQTPKVKWSPSTDITGWIYLNGQFYPYYVDSTKFILYDKMSTTQKFQTTLPNGVKWFNAYSWSSSHNGGCDLNGDGNDDIDIEGFGVATNYAHAFLDGVTGSILYSFISQSTSYYCSYPGIADMDGDGKNEIIMQETSGAITKTVVYATNGTATSVAQTVHQSPTNFALSQNYPNPFNPSTIIQYQTSERSDIRLDIYDSVGRLVRSFNLANENAGVHSITWDGNNQAGQPCSSGAYFYRVINDGHELSNKMLLLK